MASFNKVILLGNLTRDPETRTTASGLTIAKLSLAVNEHWTDREGNKQDRVTYVEIDAFGKQADLLAKYCRKGKPLMIEGRLKLDQWETSDGQKRSKLGVACENFQFLPDGSERPS
jgi:single-strand DNA-binding protein